MPTKAKRLSCIALIVILIIPIFTVLIPIPKVYAPDLTLQEIQIVTDYDTHVRLLSPATYTKFPVNALQLSQICVTGCAPDSWMRAAARFPIGGIPDNATVVYVGFNYTGTRNGANDPKPIIVELPVDPFAETAQSLYNNINTTRVYNDNSDGAFPVVAALQEIELNQLARLDLMDALSSGETHFSLGFRNDTEVGVDGTTIINSLETPVGGDPPTLTIRYYAGPVCVPESFAIEDPSALAEDGTPWVFTETRYYSFNASYSNYNSSADQVASIRFSPDGVSNVTVSFSWYNDINGVLSVNDSPDFITSTSVARLGTGASYNETSMDLWVIFPIWFTDNSPDAQYVDVYLGCTGVGYLDSGEDFHIYNQGGLTEVETEDNASFTVGAEWFEGCVFSTGSLKANQTFRKIQHYRYQFALRTYENVSGSWVPEDQFLQSQQNAGGGEEYAGPQDWDLDIALYGFDNSSDTWVRINLLNMYFIDGDKDASNEWTALYSVVSNTTADLKSDSWNGFIEQEPAARVRTWVDVWINKINSSSVIGTRVQAYYYGMETNGYWLWTTWNPMLDNITQTIAFQDILDSSGAVVQAREYDLMKIGIDLSFTTDYGLASNPYRVCLEDVNTNEVLLQDRGRLLEGVNTPIFIDVRIIDKPVGGLLGGLWIALQDLRDTLWAALSGVLGIAWDALASQFPWLTAFVDDMYSLINSFSQFLSAIASGLTTLLDFMAGQLGLFTTMVGVIGDTWALLTSWLEPFADNAGDWILLLLIVFGIIPFAANVSEGRIEKVRADIELVWGFLRTIMDWTFRLAKMAIDIVLGLIPG